MNLTCPRSGGRVLLADDHVNTGQVYAYCEHLEACGAEWSEDGAEIREAEPEPVEIRLCGPCFHRHDIGVKCERVMKFTVPGDPVREQFARPCGCVA